MCAVKDRPLPKTPDQISDHEPEIYESVDVEEKVQDIDEEGYEIVDSKLSNFNKLEDFNKLCRANQTCEDFFQYSVNEIFQCFHMCSIDKLAKQCLEQKLDGKFFQNFDLDSLKKEPFFLDTFAVLKIKKIIFEGWRPKLL